MTIIEYLKQSYGNEPIREAESGAVIPAAKSDEAEVIIEPDGYVRLSPVQDIYMAADYKARLWKKIALTALIIIVFFVIFWGFWKIGLITI